MEIRKGFNEPEKIFVTEDGDLHECYKCGYEGTEMCKAHPDSKRIWKRINAQAMLNSKERGLVKDIPKYFIYDARYRFDEDRASVMDMADSLKEAKEAAADQGDCVIVDSATGEIVE